MKLILLSGGSGSRLWPLSNTVHSKQFLRLFNSPEGKMESMVQRVVRQIRTNIPSVDIIIATSKAQKDVISTQVGNNVEMVFEPERRNTFPAIVLALSYLKSVKDTSDDEVIVVMPCDPFTTDDYFDVIGNMARTVEAGKADLVLMGVKPTEPSSKFGYIVPDKNNGMVSHFKEKPSMEMAAMLLENGALWNGGVFAFKMGYLIDQIRKYIPQITFYTILENYSLLPNISFDYEVVEAARSVAYEEFNGKWKDLGTWDTLCEELPAQNLGAGIINQSENTTVVNELSIPVIVEGGSNLIIAMSSDGVLVADKNKSNNIKNLVETLKVRPMREERRWGAYKVIDHTDNDQQGRSLTKQLTLNPGCSISYQKHNCRAEVWTFIEGTGEIVLNGERRKISRGDVISIPIGAMHALKATSELKFIEVQIGSVLTEEDIERFDFSWDE